MNRRQQQHADTQNLVIMAVLSMLVLFYWEYYIQMPQEKAQIAAIKAKQAAQAQAGGQSGTTALVIRPREEIIKDSPHLPIHATNLNGSISLKGLRFDDLTLPRYREALEPESPAVTLLSPDAAEEGYFAEFGWMAAGTTKIPDANTVWTADAKALTPETPVTLSWKNPDGIVFVTKIALDNNYLFTLTQSATSADGKPVSLATYGYINRVYDLKRHPTLGIVHEGPLGVFDSTLKESSYKKLNDDKDETFDATDGGWLGISDKYWLAAIIPPAEPFTAHFSHYDSHGRDHYQVDYQSTPHDVQVLHFFAGAKELNLLEAYSDEYHIPLFGRAVDLGHYFYWLAEPMFHLLDWFHSLVGNFGIAILLLTVVVRGVLYPLATKQFVSMNQMKALQPRMKEIQERFKDDKNQMNQAIMELYKREKVNPASGCLPIFVQLPIFISLYSVLYVSIEMRHAPFYGWIHDLSAPDPTNIFTAFGLIPWAVPTWMHLGVWPLLMCGTMVLQQKQSPPPPDPTQAKMMRIMPFFFLFLFSNVAAGLVIYWTWSNMLSILQQWHIRHRHGTGPKSGKNQPDTITTRRR